MFPVFRSRTYFLTVPGIMLAGLWAAINPAGADELQRSFSAVAEASGMDIRYGIPGFLVVENYIEGGGPVSQATLSSDQTSKSFASLPYPGSTAVSYPGLAAVLVGSAPPGYPLYVSAEHPAQPEQFVSDPSGTYGLTAKSTGSESTGDAHVLVGGQQPVSGARASSRVETTGGIVRAVASSEARGLVVGPLMVGLVTSQSRTTYSSGLSSPASETNLTVEGGRAGDLSFRFGGGGLEVAQQGVPLPASQGLAALNQGLAPAGLSIRFYDQQSLPGGAAAAAFEILSAAEVPGTGRQGSLRLRFGGATSFVSLGADPSQPYTDTMDTGSAPAPDNAAGSIDLLPRGPRPDSQLPESNSPPSPAVARPDLGSTWIPTASELRAVPGPGAVDTTSVGTPPPEDPSDVAAGATVSNASQLATPARFNASAPAGNLPRLAGVFAGLALVGVGLIAAWRVGRAKQSWRA